MTTGEPDLPPEPRGGVEIDRDKLQGRWILVSSKLGGEEQFSQEELADTSLVFEGDTIVSKKGGKILRQLVYKLDPAKTPKAMDLVEEPLEERATCGRPSVVTLPDPDPALWIYELDGEFLKICFDLSNGRSRQTEFASPPGSSLLLRIYNREKL